MKDKYIKSLFTILSAAYFLFAGVGYNVVNYCCQACAEEGIEAVATSSCSEVHHPSSSPLNKHQNGDMTCTDANHHPEGCHLLRLNIDTPSTQTAQVLSIDTINTSVLFCSFVNLLTEKTLFAFQNIIHPPSGKFLSSGREIITLHTTLQI